MFLPSVAQISTLFCLLRRRSFMKEMACMREMAQLATVLPSATQTNKQRNKQHIREVKGKIKKQRRKRKKEMAAAVAGGRGDEVR